MSTHENASAGKKVELFKLPNRLREKLPMDQRGEYVQGQIDPEAIEKADELIHDLCKNCQSTLEEQFELIKRLWGEMVNMPMSDERDELSQQIFTAAHEIKDIGAMCGYQVAAYFGESLRDFIGQTDLKQEAQRVIIQAHVDVLQIAIMQGLKDKDSEAAEELKHMVKIAVEQYS